MRIDLAMVGQGAVTPAGIGVKMLHASEPSPQLVVQLGDPKKTWPVLRVDLQDAAFTRWQKEPRVRRASPASFFMLEAADQALRGATADERAGTGLIVALSAGCLTYSRRFFDGIIRQGPRAASPALFPETVFNTPGSHVAAVLGLNGAAYALVGDEAAWVAALQTASIWLRRQRVRQVLVIGVEEFDPLVLDAYGSARWLGAKTGFLSSEGAAAVLVRSAGPADTLVIARAREGLVYRSRAQATQAAAELLRGIDPALPCYETAAHNWFGTREKDVTRGRSVFSSCGTPYLGEAFTASAAWHTLRALSLLESSRGLLPVWGLNHRVGLLELERR